MGQWEEGSLPGSHMTECMQVPGLEWKIYDGSLRCLGVDARCHLDYSLHVVSHHPAGSPDVLRQWREQHRKAKPEAARPLETLTPHSCIFTSTVLYWPSKSQSQFTFKIQYRNKLLWGGAAKNVWPYFTYQSSVQFSSVDQLCPTICSPMDWSMIGFPVHHQLWELAQTHVHQVSDAIQPSHPLSSPSPPTFKPSQHQGLFQWVSSLQQVAKVLQFHPQYQSFQWILRTDFL